MKKGIIVVALLFGRVVLGQNKVNPIHLMEGTESYISFDNNNKDTVSYIFDKYIVKSYPKKDAVGEVIKVINKTNHDLLALPTNESYHFIGIYKDLIFIDAGTSVIAQFIIYNIKIKKIILQTTYMSEACLQNTDVIYIYPFITNNPPVIPPCPEKEKIESYGGGLGYVEKRIFDLKTEKVIKTGEIHCCYFE